MKDIANHTVIADAGETLLHLLRANMTPDPIPQPEFIGLASPADKGDFMLSLFLYAVKPNGENRQNHMIARGTGTLQFPPFPVNLYYLITAHSTADLQSRALDEHQILGKAIQIFYDHAIINGSLLQGNLAESGEELRIVFDSMSMDTMISLFPNLPYKLSVSLEVGPVYVDSTRLQSTKRVLEKDFRIQG